MEHAPAALKQLARQFRGERRRLAAAQDGLERLCVDYVEPLLELLGWDVRNTLGAPPGREPVERIILPPPAGCEQPARAYLLHEQAFHYYRHHLIGVCLPPLRRCAQPVLLALDRTLSRSEVLIETMAVTDFARIAFYDNTPSEPHQVTERRRLLYTLPRAHYAAWWDALSFPASLWHNRRRFDLYAKKLRLWGYPPIREPEDEDGSGVLRSASG